MFNKIFFCLSIFLFGQFSADSQKPLLKKDLDGKWSTVNFNGISNDGRYLTYTISGSSSDSLIVLSTVSNGRIVFSGVNSSYLTQDNRRVIFKRNDSVCIMDLIEPS